MNNKMPSDTRLIIAPALSDKMDRTLITPEDAKLVIDWCEKAGVKLLDDDTGDLIGHRRIGALTYWVRYRPEAGAYRLLSVYCHRAVLAEDL
jgi:hypothetical protein